MNNNVVKLYVPYDKKEYAKILDAKWNNDMKSWYCEDRCKILIDEFSIRYVDVPYDKKDEYKKKGCLWDKANKKWYTYNSNKEV